MYHHGEIVPRSLQPLIGQRRWVAVRAQLVHLARQRYRLTTKELGRRMHRDASMISRL